MFLQQLSIPSPPSVGGLPAGAAAYAISRLLQPEDGLDEPGLATPLLVVTPTGEDAERMAASLRFHLRFLAARVDVCLFPADDIRTFGGVSPHPDTPRARLVALHRLLCDAPTVVVASARALMHRVLAPEALAGHCLSVSTGMVMARDALLQSLTHAGYLTAPVVEDVGTVSVRGDTVDVWPNGAPRPLRISFFDDEIEEIRPFDPRRRSRHAPLPRVEILPAREAIVTPEALVHAAEETGHAVDALGGGHATRRRVLSALREGLWFPGAEDYLPALHPLVDVLNYTENVVVVEFDAVAIELRRFGEAVADRWRTLPVEERPVVRPSLRHADAHTILDALRGAIQLGTFAPDAPDCGAHTNDVLRVGKGDLGPTVARLREWVAAGWQVGLVCDATGRAERVTALLAPHGLLPHPAPATTSLPMGRISLLIGDLPQGFHAPKSQVAWITADELFGRKERVRRVPRSLREAALASFTDLKAGDLIVHTRHGIGRFLGLKRLHVDGRSTDYAELEYSGGDRMYLPVTRLDQLYQYRAMGGRSPRLDKLGGESWERRKKKVSDKILAMASSLLEVHASRSASQGHAYVGLPNRYHQFVETFPYVETPDQETAIEEVLADMAEPTAMDRLIVGDVGFGKTEVAMRAAMRAVLEGKQVAVLCPTTVLAFQHAETFRERFEGFAVNIRLLSRFQSAAQSREILTQTVNGAVDILVGTAAILSRKLRFQDLGLVIIDEEHRFGVRQKTALRKLSGQRRQAVEYLAMSATPIPRTLHMAMAGLRTISMIATPPAGRSAIRTHVIRHSDERIREHMVHELQRGGQIFYVHNRVQSIERVALRLQALVPEAQIAVAHGQLEEAELERVLVRFVKQQANVLLTTTIIESGVDLPNVNTMIVENADKFGLAQLYQLRGRVGRGATKGYCVLSVPPDGALSADAMRRLRVLQEHSELGSGFAIASADLEMRGSGNLLGKAQHGHIQAVGLDTYIELLEEASATARGERSLHRLDPEVDIPVSMILPEDYIADLNERLTAYRQIAAARTLPAVRALVDGWEDEYGSPPPEVLNLGWSAEARIRCRALGIDRVSWMRVRVVLRFHETTPVPPEVLPTLIAKHARRMSLGEEAGATVLYARFTPAEGERPFRYLHWLLRQLESEVNPSS